MPDIAASVVPLLLTMLLYVCIGPSLDRRDNRARALVAGATVVLMLRYAWWRWDATLRPVDAEPTLAYAWAVVYFVAELALIVESVIFFVLMSRTIDRTPEADAHERWLAAQAASAPATLPSVDVFVPTYNEGWDVLEKTLVAACVLDYPTFQVHLLDDGARPWLREKCDELGVHYIVRPDRRHAKAGNINHALGVTSADLVLVLDADFVPQRNFLARTVGFFRDPAVGIVQVPHHFFNTDPLQANLGLHQRYSDDQEFFFRDIMPARDAWGVAFSCGSNSVNRRAALERIGGIPTSSITEDMLSSIVLLQHGYRTIYLNERLARGLAPEGLAAMYTQRARWARGGIQCLFLPEGPVRARGLTIGERLFSLPISWITTYLGMPIVMLGPLLFLWFGLVAMPLATGAELVSYQLPMILASLAATQLLPEVRRNPIIGSAYQLFLAFRLTPVVLHSLVRPFAVGFKVTPKGAAAERSFADVRGVVISTGAIVLTIVGLVLNELPQFQRLSADAFVGPSVLWGAVTLAVLLVCLMMSYEFPRRRTEERFVIDEGHEASLGDGDIRRRVPAWVLDLAVGGAALRVPGEIPGEPVPLGHALTLHLSDVGDLRARVVRHVRAGVVGVVFEEVPREVRCYLVAKVFAHAYENHGKHVQQASAMRALAARLFGFASAGAVRVRDAASVPDHGGLRPKLDVPPALAYPRLPRRAVEEEPGEAVAHGGVSAAGPAAGLAAASGATRAIPRPSVRRIAAA